MDERKDYVVTLTTTCRVKALGEEGARALAIDRTTDSCRDSAGFMSTEVREVGKTEKAEDVAQSMSEEMLMANLECEEDVLDIAFHLAAHALGSKVGAELHQHHGLDDEDYQKVRDALYEAWERIFEVRFAPDRVAYQASGLGYGE